MRTKPSLAEALLGIEGLALMRLAFTGSPEDRAARIREMRSLIERLDEEPELTAPIDGPEYDITQGYRLWSETYDRPLRLFPVEEPTMLKLIDTLSPSVVLDAACGTGRYSRYLVDRGHDVIGVDRSVEMLKKARGKIPEAEFHEGELTDLPLEDDSVDAAVCALAFVHLDEIHDVLAELGRVVRSGGRIILSDVHPFIVMLGWQAQFRTAGGDPAFMRLHAHLPSEYCDACMAAGLRIRGCYEPPLTATSAVTPAADRLPEANRAAFVGLPGVIIWDLEKP